MQRRNGSAGLMVAAVSLLALGASASGGDAPRGLERWADPGLKVTRGLALWLDAGRLNEARRAHGEAALVEDARIPVWYDGSGRGRDLAQEAESAQPRYLAGAVRFDGDTSYLQRIEPTTHLKDFTLFLVAAPLSNSGGFRAFAALHEKDQQDYTSGVNVDLGAGLTTRFDVLNIEGKGFGGMRNLLDQPSAFGVVRRTTITSTPGAGGTKVFTDGREAQSRDRQDSAFAIDRILIGARFYGFPPAVHGFLDGDIAQVLLYDRVLDEAERREVERYLIDRTGGDGLVTRPPRPVVGRPLVMVANPPPVQMLAPGFSWRELPVNLTNINNIRYRPDGKLVALGYDGNIHLLSDRDGDGLEETVEPFWVNPGGLVAPIGMALTPAGYPRGEGLFVASKGKVSLIVDTDHDGRADREIVVAQGWKELPHGVDALGVALDSQGNIYFGLGATDFTNAYQVDREGNAAYRLQDEHGTIQKIAADFSRREIIATGIRFPVGLAFNRAGDLFATDQEGATWLANGNPFDELLHIQADRHYGFPPRHPRRLPDVIDEPSVFDYTPQHQSTCGLVFNEPVNGGPTFGPAHWSGEALITGYSRGKLFRTELVSTPAGYVARTHLLAVLNMLAADCCVTPRGDLVVAAHSGQPDWGSGPRGQGKLYKIALEDREAPQPLFAWAAGMQEVRVAYDRPVDPLTLRDLARRATIEYGRAVSPADRFESLRPGYEAVARQLAAPRFALPVLSAQVAADGRTLIVATAPQPSALSYALTLPDARTAPGAAEVDLGYDLSGVEATWTAEGAAGPSSIWLPHPALAVARAFTAGSAEHDRFWELITRPGRLTLRARIDLWQMLRPAAQPGSDPGYELPEEQVTLALAAPVPFEVRAGEGPITVQRGDDGRYRASITTTPHRRDPLPLEINLPTGAGHGVALDLSWNTREDERLRALPLRRVLLPWASLEERSAEEDQAAPREVAELKGGDWSRGRALFYGDTARCSACHAVRGRGGVIGPDLSNLVHRDFASVFRDVHTPSAAINPDFVAHSVALADGRVLQGTLRTDGDNLIVGDTGGKQTTVPRGEVEASAPSAVSIMPEGLDATLGPERLRDLLTFLLTDPLGPAKLEIEGAPPPRRRAELNAALEGSAVVENPRRLKIVLAGGPKDHGPGEHDYPLWQTRWAALLATDPSLSVETAAGWPSADQIDSADVIVMYSNNPGWDAAKAGELDRYFARGGGLVLIHYAVDGHQAVDALAGRIGLAWQGGKSAFRHGPLDVDCTGANHPITRGFGKLRLVDESYWNLVGDPASIAVLGTGVEDGQPRPLFWTRRVGRSRVFVSIPGHYTWTFDDPLFRLLILRGMAWTAREPVDRFNELTTLGARIVE